MQTKPTAPVAPVECPKCGYDLKSDGYPLGHQNDEGEECPFTWVPGNPFDYDED